MSVPEAVILPTTHAGPGGSERGATRLRRRQDFVAVLRDGRRLRHRLLSLGLRPNGLPHHRYGYAIGKRVGTAVVRNRIRRRLREIVRALPLASDPLVPSYDLVLTAGDQSATATYEQLRTAVRHCAERAGILLATGENVTTSGETS